MAEHNNVKKELLAKLSDSKHEDHHNDVVKRRIYRRARSDPLLEYNIKSKEKSNGPDPDPDPDNSAQSSQSLFGNPHRSFRQLAVLLLIYLGIGATCFYAVKDHISGKKTNSFVDAFYFCIVTMTTVGYGDLVPQSTLSKFLACAFVFSGMALVGLILSKGADYLVEKQEVLVARALNMSEELSPSDIMEKIETNKTRYKCLLVLVLLLILIICGTIFLAFVEKLEFVDAFYCVCVTITTLGYGDHSFSTVGGRVFAIFWILTSTICLGQFFFYVAELNTEEKQKVIVKRVLDRPVTNVDLESADIDGDGSVDAAEFVLYKLKEMGKISEEDISLVMEEFEELDVDQSGTLSPSDITLAQSSSEGRNID